MLHIQKRMFMPFWQRMLIRFIAIVLALLLNAILIFALTKMNPLDVYVTMFNGVFGMGSRVWNAIPWDLGFGKAEKVADDIFRYPFEDRSFLLVGLHHPSIGYPSDASHQLLARAGAAVE